MQVSSRLGCRLSFQLEGQYPSNLHYDSVQVIHRCRCRGLQDSLLLAASWERENQLPLSDLLFQVLATNQKHSLRSVLMLWWKPWTNHRIKNFSSKICSKSKQLLKSLMMWNQCRDFVRIIQRFSELYGQNPDIDSTSLIISATAWILNKSLKRNSLSGGSSMVSTTASEHSADYVSGLLLKLGITDPTKAIDFLVPRMLQAVDYLASRDIDNDGLIEQSHNEDWMDTVLRAGKIVYSQACWILALKNLSSLLVTTGKQNESDRIRRMAEKAIEAVEQILWSEKDGAYIDIQETHHIGGPYRTLTQDVSLYLVAISENSARENLTNNREQGLPREKTGDLNLHRANRTLDALRNRVWKEKWPLVTEVVLKSTGPWLLKPYQYHNLTFWPWTTGIEMLARSRFDRVEECNLLLSLLTSESELHMHTFYEWINPITDE